MHGDADDEDFGALGLPDELDRCAAADRRGGTR